MKLSYAPRSRSIRPRWLLEELEVPYEAVRAEEVPVLVDGDLTLSECSAICLYLADRFPEKRLAPPIASPDRGPYLQWLLFAEVTLEPAVLEHLYKPGVPDRARINALLAVIDARLDGREFIVGEAFTAADLSLASILHLANTLKLLEQHPRIFDYVHRQTARPAIRRALAG